MKKRQPSPNIRLHGPTLKRVQELAKTERRPLNTMAIILVERGLLQFAANRA
jgi:hypothetical protein